MKNKNPGGSVPVKTAIDWDAVHRRLSETGAATEKRWVPGPMEQKKILRTRARAIAGEPPPEESPGGQITIIEFLLAHERYAVDLSFVREVCPLKELTPLPGTQPFVIGIINIRGQIISIIDMKKFFELPEKGLTDLNKVIVLDDGSMTFGLLVDAVYNVNRVSLQAMQPVLPTLTGMRQQYLKGVTGDRLIILDAAKILADPRVTIRDQAPV